MLNGAVSSKAHLYWLTVPRLEVMRFTPYLHFYALKSIVQWYHSQLYMINSCQNVLQNANY